MELIILRVKNVPVSRTSQDRNQAKRGIARLAHEEFNARDCLELTKANARRWCSKPISSWKSARVDLARLESWPRQCMNRLTLMRRNMARTHAALRWRTRLRSSS